jgi:inhibitor of KinA
VPPAHTNMIAETAAWGTSCPEGKLRGRIPPGYHDAGHSGCRILSNGMAIPAAEDARFVSASDQSLLVYLGEQITPRAHERVAKLLLLLQSEPISGVRNLHPAYCSLLVKFDALKVDHAQLEAILRRYLARLGQAELPPARRLEIPVCYGGEFGEDLDEVAALHGMSAARVIELHTSVTYLVYFLGFVPGFAYLGELPEALATPRLAVPRKALPPGSVGIAGNQTGVYPFSTPGGWRLIGRTPMPMFRPDRIDMSVLSLGDHVRFVSVPGNRFEEFARA